MTRLTKWWTEIHEQTRDRHGQTDWRPLFQHIDTRPLPRSIYWPSGLRQETENGQDTLSSNTQTSNCLHSLFTSPLVHSPGSHQIPCPTSNGENRWGISKHMQFHVFPDERARIGHHRESRPLQGRELPQLKEGGRPSLRGRIWNPCVPKSQTPDSGNLSGASKCCGAFEINHQVSLEAGYGTLFTGGPRGSDQVDFALLDPLQKVGYLFYSHNPQATSKSKP